MLFVLSKQIRHSYQNGKLFYKKIVEYYKKQVKISQKNSIVEIVLLLSNEK